MNTRNIGMEKDKLNKIDGKWEFDEGVTQVFTDMLSRSIPNYEVMRSMSYLVGRGFLQGGTVLDVGCSNGLASEMFVKNTDGEHYVMSDVSEPMLAACAKRYAKEIAEGTVEVCRNDLRYGLPPKGGDVDLVISCLTIQFTPIEYRQNILARIYSAIREGGALLLVEKVLGNSAEIDTIFVDEYYGIKRDNEYTEEQIRNKRQSLEGVLVPLTASFNEYLPAQAGFKKVDCFWRCLNFSGWIAIK